MPICGDEFVLYIVLHYFPQEAIAVGEKYFREKISSR